MNQFTADDSHYRYPVMVMAMHDLNGHIVPRAFRRPGGPRVLVDRVLIEEQAVALKAGGAGVRYTCCITNEITGVQAQVYLFCEGINGGWFVEWPCQ